MKNKTVSILLLNLFLSIALFGNSREDSIKVKELGFTLHDLSSITFSLQFKIQLKKETRFLKFSLSNLSFYKKYVAPPYPTHFPINQIIISAGAMIGLEFRKNLTNTFSLFHGPNISCSYNITRTTIENPAMSVKERNYFSDVFRPSLPYTFGLMYQINKNILLSTSINPNIFFTVNRTDRTYDFNIQKSYSSGINFNGTFSYLTFVYRFKK